MPTNPDEPYYCSQQINIPPDLPDILKQFTKAAIRTQPKDVLAWSAAYFRAMAKGETPPVKERLEMPVATQKTDTGLTPGLLRVLNRQLGPKKVVPVNKIEVKWLDLALPKEQFDDLIRIGNFCGDVEWNKFFALAASALGADITDAMKVICEILTADAEGGPARIAFRLFTDLYSYLAQIDGEISQQHVSDVIGHLQYEVDKQDGYVMPRNFLSPDCPPLSA
ncbi:ropporin-1-like protein [Gigantopelta aegis]|uniref:ropporin-1-like protein n=1 Tax=Gigantopelta aegis TaxID=1735272 RepID=UPI001B88DFA4|nr:ropporin-1-like protein [Gigantopelta aegis]XP_041365995.1 ropporin-1-like protein [Gigantopelta aegis]XP_041365996.1 ropporin-1-like protein [Gigantopelta aegis]